MTKQGDPQQVEMARRRRMIDDQIRRRGVRNPRVLDAMLAVPRDRFVPPDARYAAHEDRALPIGHGQTISQPYIVAHMTELLTPTADCTVLEIGTGTGYQTAILAHLCRRVFSVERLAVLAERAGANLAALGLENVTLSMGDGSVGLPLHAPYDRIMVTAAAPETPPALVDQLADGGILVIPVGGKTQQTLVRVQREGKRTVETPLLACRFVKLVGREGWAPDDAPA